jgi:hypothetical protein
LVLLLSNGPKQLTKGCLLRSCVLPFDWTDEIVEVKLEIIDVEASLAEPRAAFISFINRTVK